MRTISKEVHITKDGKEFLDKEEAAKHEKRIDKTKYYVVTGTKGDKTTNVNLIIEAEVDHYKIAEMVAYKHFRQKYYFWSGVVKSKNIELLFDIRQVDKIEMDEKEYKLELIEGTDFFEEYFM